jgi:glyoxylase-like metal-dependent hydrolase (beta-lactamase superfamily II)
MNMEIIPGLHLITGRAANVYLTIDSKGGILIDTGLPRKHKAILKFLSRLTLKPADVKHIIITHADGDHYGSLGALKEICNAQAYASPVEAEAIQAGLQSRPLKLTGLGKMLFDWTYPLFRPRATPVDHLLAEGQTLPLWGGLQVISTPGHTPGHISLFSREHSILFCGDSIRVNKAGELIPSRGANTWDESLALESVRSQAALGPKIVCPGHGSVVYNAGSKFPSI